MTTAHPTRTVAEIFGVPEPPTQGRDRLVGTAIELFYRLGFNAVGIDRVIAEAGVSKTTFYKHFESKDDLIIAAIKTRDDWETVAWTRAVRKIAGDDARRELRALFEVLDEWFNAEDFRGCMFLSAATEFPNPNDPIHRAAAAHKTTFRKYVRETAIRAGAMEPDAFADAFALLFEGTLVMRQIYGRDDAAKIALATVDQLLSRYLDGGDAA